MTTCTCIVSQAENNDVSEKRMALIYGEIPPVFIILYDHVLYDPFDSVTVLNMVSPFSIIRTHVITCSSYSHNLNSNLCIHYHNFIYYTK